MDTARVISEAELVRNRAAGYEMVKGEWRNQAWVSPSLNTTADGALYLTVRDLASWDAALTARRLLEASSYEAMWTPVSSKQRLRRAWYGLDGGWAPSTATTRCRTVVPGKGFWRELRAMSAMKSPS